MEDFGRTTPPPIGGAAVQNLNFEDPRYFARIVKPFRVTLSGTGAGSSYATVWTPKSQHRFRLLGGVFDAFVGSTITTATVDELTFFDGSATTRGLYPICKVENTWATARELAYDRKMELPTSGVLSSTVGNALTINVNTPASFTAGTIVIRGVLWGVEEKA